MIAAACTAIAVVALGAALRPRPAMRRPRRPLAVEAVPRIRGRRFRPRRAPQVTAASVAVWCESMARVVRSGSSLTTAIRSTEPPPGAEELITQFILAIDRGGRLADAVAAPTDSPHLHLALVVLRACATNGGPPAEPLDRAAATLRGRAADVGERQTQSAQARLSAIVMTVLPVAMLGLLLLTSSSVRTAATGPVGLAAVGVGGALNLIGWRWMRRIISGTIS